MDVNNALNELEALAKKLDVEVVYDRFTGETAGHGGLCKLKGKWRVMIERRCSPGERVSVLADALSRFDLEEQFLAPDVRALIERLATRRQKKRAQAKASPTAEAAANAPSTDAAVSAEATDAAGPSEATDAAVSAEATDAAGPSEATDAAGSPEAMDAVVSAEAMDAAGPSEAMDAAGPSEAMDAAGPSEATDATEFPADSAAEVEPSAGKPTDSKE